MNETVTDLKQELSAMQAIRSNFEWHWTELINYLLPFRQRINYELPQGAKAMQYIKDGTGTQALCLFAGGISSKMANKAIPWFRLEVEDEALKEDREVKLWLEQVEQIFYNVFEKSNFYAADQEANLDVGAFGTAPMYIGKHPTWGVCYQTLSLGETFVDINEFNVVDTMFRVFKQSAKQLFQAWGNQVSEAVQKALADKKPTQQFKILHAVKPRLERDTRAFDNKNMPWSSYYVELESNHVLNESGYREFPYIVSRYFVMSGEVYGRSIGMIALPDVKELQARTRDTSRAGQLALEPPVLLPNDGFAGMPIQRKPGGVSFVRMDGAMQDKIGVFPTASNLPWSEESMEKLRERIGRTFFSDLMILSQDRETTLGEFLQVAQEKMQLLGPFLGRLQTERYNPLFDRTFSVLWDQGWIPPAPPQIMGPGGYIKMKVDYISPLAKAQKISQSQGIVQASGFLGQIMAVRPEVGDILNWDDTVREYLELTGIPTKLIQDPKIVDQVRQAREQKQQQQEMAAAAMHGAGTIPALSKGPEPGSPMDQLQQAIQSGAGNAPGQIPGNFGPNSGVAGNASDGLE